MFKIRFFPTTSEKPVKRRQADQDSPWKEVLERYFEQFLAFFFPAAHAAVDWAKDHVFLDKELQKVARDAALGRRLVDKLVRVHGNGDALNLLEMGTPLTY